VRRMKFVRNNQVYFSLAIWGEWCLKYVAC
jgi:hypothetical protein